ncbi:MAG: hypothetical protein IJ832_04880 [Bacteroidaceae bacterium]|nr:hypothetical protein [Bacteroidaceae bacterium]
MAETVSFLIKISDDGTFKKVEVDADSLRGAIGKVKDTVDELKGSIINWSEAAQSFSQLKEGIDGIVSVVGQLTEAYGQAEVAEAKLVNNMRNTMAATEEDVAAVNRLIDAQKELGVVDDDVQRAGAQELATYLEKRSSLEKLIPVMNDMLAQQYGLEASQESAAIIASMLGKVMDGQVGALSRYGYKFDEAQEKVLKFGTEEERAAVLADVVESAVGGMNEALAQTDAGQTKKLADGFADVGKWVGGLLSPLQSVLNSVQTLGMAAFSVGQIIMAFKSAHDAIVKMDLASKLANLGILQMVKNYIVFGTATRGAAVANGVLSASLYGVAGAATTARMALRAFLVSTGIGIAVVALTEGVNALIDALTGTDDAADQAADGINSVEDSAERASRAFAQTQADTYSQLMTKYTELQNQWKSLSDAHSKAKWIEQNRQSLRELGLEINSVDGAEDAFKKNTQAVVDSFVARAQAAARLAQLTEEYRLQMELTDRIQRADQAAAGRHPKVKAGDKVPEGIPHTEDGGMMKLGADQAWHYTEKGAAEQNKYKWVANDAQTKADRAALRASEARTTRLQTEIARDAGQNRGLTFGTPAPTPRPTATTNTHNSGDTSEEPKGLIGRAEAKLQELRKQITEAENEADAAGLQKMYLEEEGKLKELKIRIGLEKPDKQEVKEEAKTHVEQLHESLQQAQRDKDNALSVQARVEAQARIDDIQAQIDAATQGEVTIKAAAEPGYVEKGSDADKRMSWQNALGRVGDLQADIDIGLIGFEEAQGELQKLQKLLDQLGISAKLPELKAPGADKAEEKFDYANRSVQMLGQSLQGLGSALELPELDVAGVLAQAIATMIMGYAEATKMATEIGGPWAWLAFGATGLAQLTAMVSSIKGMAKFANGGIVSGPTIGLIGEYANASTNPEVIAPLDKLSNMMNTGGGNGGTIRLRVSGRDLVGVVQNEVAAAGKSGRRLEI